jgi:c(7)-type cytochrome triheme protein
MTIRKLIPMLAALLLGGAALANDLPHLPGATKLAQSGESPGVVTFNHDMHVDTAKPAGSCTACHPRLFSIMGRSATKKVSAITHAAMEKGESCGACHGKQAFNFEDCTMCHAM